MPLRSTAIAAAISVLALGSPLISGCTNPLAVMSSSSGMQKYEQGNHQGAIADFTRAIEFNPQYADAYYSRGIAKHELNDYQGAIDDYTKAIEVDPRYAAAYYNRGIAKELANDLEGACSDWSQAARLGDQTPVEWIKEQCQ